MTAQMEITQAMIELRLENVTLREDVIRLKSELLMAGLHATIDAHRPRRRVLDRVKN